MRRDPHLALIAAGLGALLICLAWLLAFHVAPARELDQRIADGFAGLSSTRADGPTRWIPYLSNPEPFALWFVLIVGTAIWRGRLRLAVTVAIVLIGSSMTTALLKPALPIVRFIGGEKVGPAAFPSGHATASMALALCAILVTPAGRRTLVAALGAIFTLAVTFTLLIAAWHFPSDVVAGYLMAGTWTAMGVAVLWWLEARRPAEALAAIPAGPPALELRDALRPVLAVVAGAVGLTLFVLVVRPDAVLDYARAHTTFVVGAGVIGVLALALVGVLAAAAPTSRRPERAS